MSAPINPLLQQADVPAAATGARHTAQQQQWQQQLARAQGQTIVAQSRSALPAFASHPQAQPPKALRVPPGMQMESAGRAATPPAQFDTLPATTPQSPRQDANREGSGFLREAAYSPTPRPLEQQSRAERLDPDIAALTKALQPLAPEAESDLRIDVQHTERGLIVALHITGPLAQHTDALRAATLVFFSRQGFYVAGISLNGASIFEARRSADSLDPIAMKD